MDVKLRIPFLHVTVIMDNVPMGRSQATLVAWHRPFHRANTKVTLSAIERHSSRHCHAAELVVANVNLAP